MKNAGFVMRVRVIAAVCTVVAIVIIGRLYVLQIVRGDMYTAKADAQFVEPAVPLLNRNSIFFSDKNGTQILAASVASGFSLILNPTKITDPEALYKEVAQLTKLSHDEFIQKAKTPRTQYVVIARHMESSVGLTLRAKNLPGVILEEDRWRVYPGGSLAAQEIGFVAYNADVQEGRYGLERYYEQTLARTDENLYANFFVELFGSVQAILSGASQTGDLVTTIEPSVQAELERTLLVYEKDWNPKLSGGIIMDPKTGEIYAMAINPTFDLNEFNAQSGTSIFANPLVEDVYEMGSIIKPLTVAAGLDSGAITPETTYKDTGKIEVDGKTISNFDGVARGVIPMQEILSQSLNLGASFVATRMGSSTMRDYFLNHYKLGQETGIDLPGEIHGLVDNIIKSPRLVEYDTASFGQGIAITPIATVRALATLANGGVLVTPHLVREVLYDAGPKRTLAWGNQEQVLKPETSLAVSRMLTQVVDVALANGTIKLPHYSVAAKTGTAQIANPSGGGYYADRFLHSFFGYFPSYDAKFIVFLFALEPQGAPFASQTLAPPFHTLTQFLINYYNVPPDR